MKGLERFPIMYSGRRVAAGPSAGRKTGESKDKLCSTRIPTSATGGGRYTITGSALIAGGPARCVGSSFLPPLPLRRRCVRGRTSDGCHIPATVRWSIRAASAVAAQRSRLGVSPTSPSLTVGAREKPASASVLRRTLGLSAMCGDMSTRRSKARSDPTVRRPRTRRSRRVGCGRSRREARHDPLGRRQRDVTT